MQVKEKGKGKDALIRVICKYSGDVETKVDADPEATEAAKAAEGETEEIKPIESTYINCFDSDGGRSLTPDQEDEDEENGYGMSMSV